jgi:excisionase family DNA binding protein
MNGTYLTVGEVANLLQISKPLVYRLVSKRKIGALRFGRVVRIPQKDLDTFIRKNSMPLDYNGRLEGGTNNPIDIM